MTNAPILLTMDCDMYSNDPWTAQRALCYLPNKSQRPNCGYVQFPQRFCGFNKADIYASEYKRLFVCNPIGMDGLNGPSYVGTGCFFRRRIFFGGPSTFTPPETPELGPDHIVNKLIDSEEVLNLAHHVAECNYENQTKWGSKIGFRYGSLVEDYYTGYMLQCEGWQSIFCNPRRPAFLGDVPICLVDVLNQNKRWCVGLLEVVFSRYSPLTFGIKAMGFLMAQCYAHYALWPLLVIPITIYAFIPSLALLQGTPIFPKIGDPMFLLYVFLFVGAYGQDCLDFVFTQGTLMKWWSDQRCWLLRGLSSCLFGFIEYAANLLGVAASGFHVTSKVMDDELCKRYDHGIFEFGIWSPLFIPIATAAIMNLAAFVGGSARAFADRRIGEFLVEVFITGFGVVNGLPIYEAMFWRSDRGRMSGRVTITSALLAGALCGIAFLVA